MADKSERVVILTPLCRFQYVSAFSPKSYDEGADKYEATCLFPKTGADTADLTLMKAAAGKAAADKWGDKIPANLKNPFRDGDGVTWDGFAGNTFVRVSSIYAPKVINTANVKLVSPEQFYSGCWGYASLNAYAYDNKGNKGVSFGLKNLMFVRDDTPFSGGGSAEDDFSGLLDEKAVAAAKAGESSGESASPGSDGSIFD